MTPHDCNTLVREFGAVRLLAASVDAGPYVVRVGGVTVGAFGFSRGHEEASDFVDQNSHHQQLTAYTLARIAFEAITLHAESDDPSALRQLARAACRASRKLWPVLGYGATEAIRETHAKLVGDAAAKAAKFAA